VTITIVRLRGSSPTNRVHPTMVAFAIGTGRVFAILGAIAFAASDTILGWTRFVGELPRSRTIVMVTYHLGQMGLVLALI